MYALLIILHILISATLIITVLLQAGRGGGLSGLAAGGGLQTAFGAEAGDVMKKATSVVAVLFMITSLTLAFISAKRGASVVADIKPEQTPDTPARQQQQPASGPVVRKKAVKIDPVTGKPIEIEEKVVEKPELGKKIKGMIEKFGETTAPKEKQKTEETDQMLQERLPFEVPSLHEEQEKGSQKEEETKDSFETKPLFPVESTPTE